jgi:hypothetical protein
MRYHGPERDEENNPMQSKSNMHLAVALPREIEA